MRDLRAELRSRGADAPVDWTPKEGDIIVGYVRAVPPTDAGKGESGTFLVCEERALTPVRVRLDSPQLAALVELHNPRENERVGIKYVGQDADGVKRYQMIVDRGVQDTETKHPAPLTNTTEEPCSDCGLDAATPEEKQYIRSLLAQDVESPDTRNRPQAPEPASLEGLISHQQEELERQPRALEKLEAVIRPTHSERADCAPETEEPHTRCAASGECATREAPRLAAQAAARRRRMRSVIGWLTAFALTAGGTAYVVLTGALTSWRP